MIKKIKGSKVLIMGLTYKENVADIRESPTKEIIKELREYGVEIWGYDPLLNNFEREFEVKAVQVLAEVPKVDAIIMTVAHDIFQVITLDKLRYLMNDYPVLIDIRGTLNKEAAERESFHNW